MTLPCITIQQLRDSKLQYAVCHKDSLLVTDKVETISRFRLPCRIDAVTVLLCISGDVECVINLNRYHMSRDMVLIGLPDDIIQIESSHGLEAYAVLMSLPQLNELDLDNGLRSDFYLRLRQNAMFHLSQEHMLSLKPYYALLCNCIHDAADEADEIMRGLLHAFAYSIISKINLCQTQHDGGGADNSSHSKQLFGEFMALVKCHHASHRGVKFYADKLCLTPNYLSGTIREYTGKTATEWVNEFVILEAKIMLKDTSSSIQEIAYRLHFPDQSTFGKYFKKITGLSPKQYRER